MNKEQTKKTFGQIAYEAFNIPFATMKASWNEVEHKEAFEKSAQAVRDAVLAELPEWYHLPKRSILQKGDQLSQHGMEFAEIVPTLVGEQMPRHCHGIRRLRPAATVPPPFGTPKEIRPPASGMETSRADVPPDERKPKHAVGDAVEVIPTGSTGKINEVREASVGFIYQVDGTDGWALEEQLRHLPTPSAPQPAPVSQYLFLQVVGQRGEARKERDAALKRAEEAEESHNLARRAVTEQRNNIHELKKELAALRASVPVWVPITTPAKEEDAVDGSLWFLPEEGDEDKIYIDNWEFAGQNTPGYSHWMRPIPRPIALPLPVETGSAEAQMRKEFEKWAVESLSLPIEKDHDGDYVRDETEDAWAVWKDAFLAGQQSTKP